MPFRRLIVPLIPILAAGWACSGSGDEDSGDGDGDGHTTTDATGGSDSGASGGDSGDGGTDSTGGWTSTGGDGADDDDCTTPPAPSELVGWASEAGGVTGGGNEAPVVVTDTPGFAAAVAGDAPAVIHLNGSVSSGMQRFPIGSNKTIVGVCGAEINGSIGIEDASNVILRNVRVVGNNCSDSPGDCSGGSDAIGVRGSDHIWFDHLDVLDGSDGNLDMTHDSDYITISWTKFFYTGSSRDHRFSNLIAGSDDDAGDYRITFHHNWWAENVDQRMPRSRFGDIHVFNNLFTSAGNSYCTNAGFDAHLLVENNIYRDVNDPLRPDGNGFMVATGNVFENTSGDDQGNGGPAFDPPYDYTLDATDGLDTLIQTEAGPQD